jgi:hypothetical protein
MLFRLGTFSRPINLHVISVKKTIRRSVDARRLVKAEHLHYCATIPKTVALFENLAASVVLREEMFRLRWSFQEVVPANLVSDPHPPTGI